MFFDNYIRHNFWWKLLSLLLAALTWLTIKTAFDRDKNLRASPVVDSYTRVFPTVPITQMMSTTTTNRYYFMPATVAVELTGSASDLKQLQLRDVQAFMNVSDHKDTRQFRARVQVLVAGDSMVNVKSITPPFAEAQRITAETGK